MDRSGRGRGLAAAVSPRSRAGPARPSPRVRSPGPARPRPRAAARSPARARPRRGARARPPYGRRRRPAPGAVKSGLVKVRSNPAWSSSADGRSVKFGRSGPGQVLSPEKPPTTGSSSGRPRVRGKRGKDRARARRRLAAVRSSSEPWRRSKLPLAVTPPATGSVKFGRSQLGQVLAPGLELAAHAASVKFCNGVSEACRPFDEALPFGYTTCRSWLMARPCRPLLS